METFCIETDRLKLFIAHPRFTDELNGLILDSFDTLHSCLIMAQYPPSLDQTRDMLTKCFAGFEKNEFMMIIFLKSEQKIIGMCSTDEANPPTIQIHGMVPYDTGYWLHKSYVGYGYATEATKGLIKYVHEKHKINLFSLYCSLDNLRSNKTARRLNFELFGAKEIPANPNYKRSDWPDPELLNVYILQF